MTLRDEVAQLVFIAFHGEAPNSRTREYRKFMRLIRETKVGGLILVNVSNGRVIAKAEPYALATFLNRMQRLTRVPLMVGGDFERGASMRVDGTTVFPHAMAFGATGDPALLALRRRSDRARSSRPGRAVGLLPGGRRQQQSRQPHHQHPLVRRESAGSGGATSRPSSKARMPTNATTCWPPPSTFPAMATPPSIHT